MKKLLTFFAFLCILSGFLVAQTLLEIAGLDDFEEPIYLPMTNKSMQISNSIESNNIAIDFNDCIEVYPNPASDELWVEYILLNDNAINKVEMLSLDGKTVLTQSIRNNYGVEQIDISKIISGNYVIKLGNYSKQISIIK
ncbi:MAG: T9SS type A sorting domain-containing protein [Bacteroidota bacterium]